MQCEHCGQRPATVHQTVVMNGQKQESHLCEVCAEDKGNIEMFNQPNFPFPNLSMQQLLSSFLGQDPLGGASVLARKKTEPRCPNCGLTYSQFAETGNLGCAECYDNFEPYLVPLIKRIHGTTTHAGKAPKRTGGVARKRRELDGLRNRLQDAVANERYEAAARLRDSIRTLENKIAGGESGAVE